MGKSALTIQFIQGHVSRGVCDDRAGLLLVGGESRRWTRGRGFGDDGPEEKKVGQVKAQRIAL